MGYSSPGYVTIVSKSTAITSAMISGAVLGASAAKAKYVQWSRMAEMEAAGRFDIYDSTFAMNLLRQLRRWYLSGEWGFIPEELHEDFKKEPPLADQYIKDIADAYMMTKGLCPAQAAYDAYYNRYSYDPFQRFNREYSLFQNHKGQYTFLDTIDDTGPQPDMVTVLITSKSIDDQQATIVTRLYCRDGKPEGVEDYGCLMPIYLPEGVHEGVYMVDNQPRYGLYVTGLDEGVDPTVTVQIEGARTFDKKCTKSVIRKMSDNSILLSIPTNNGREVVPVLKWPNRLSFMPVKYSEQIQRWSYIY